MSMIPLLFVDVSIALMGTGCIPKVSGIYMFRCRPTGKNYVGSSVNLRKRFLSHVHELRKGTHHSRYLQNAWNKYGIESFEFHVLEFSSVSLLLSREQAYMAVCMALYPTGYNMLAKAGTTLGRRFTEETKRKMSLVALGRKQSPEAIAKTAAANRGRKRPHTPESKAKLKAACVKWIGVPLSDETRAKMSAVRKGKVRSPEHCAAIAQWRTGRKASPEARAKMAASAKLAWARKKAATL